MELFRQAQFATLDLMRRAQGHALGAIGFDPAELTHRILASGDHWRLRDYGGAEASLLIVAAPIKRSYIWDMGPNLSAIRTLLNHGVRVYLLEWIAPTASGGHVGLDECARAISECVARIATEPKATKPFLIGHSLGGTLAAAFCACEPRAMRGLLLLGAPLRFRGSWSIRLQNGCIGKTGSAEAISPCWVTRSARHVSTFRRSRSSIRQTTLHRSPLLNLSLMRCLPRTLRSSNTPAKSALHCSTSEFFWGGRLTCISGRRSSLGWRRIAHSPGAANQRGYW